MKVDPLTLLEPLESAETDRMVRARQILDRQAGQWESQLAKDISTDRREIAALALARSQGGGIADLQTQMAMEQQRAQALPAAGSASEAGAQASQMAASGLALQGAQAQAGESAQMQGMGMNVLAKDFRNNYMREIKEREFAMSLVQMSLQNEARALGRNAREYAAQRGIQADQYIQGVQQEAQRRGRMVAAGTALVGAGLSAYAKLPKSDSPGKPIVGAPMSPSIPTAPSTSDITGMPDPGRMVA